MTGSGADELSLPDFRAVLDGLPDGLAVIDATGTVVLINAEARALLGDDLEGRPFGLPLLNAEQTAELDVLTGHGQTRVVEMRVTGTTLSATRARLVAFRDVTDRKADETALKRREERYELAVRGANDGLWDWDLGNDRLHVSARWCEIVGLESVDLDADSDLWFDRVHPDDEADLHAAIGDHLSGRAVTLHHEHRLAHRDGSWVWVLARGVAVFDDSDATRAAGSLTDICDRKALEQRLRHEAMHDPLTGLANRRLFLDRLDQAVNRGSRHPAPFAVAVLDLDGFKEVNDTHGHEVGDRLLTIVAERLTQILRPADTVSRFGGDEFAVLFDEVGDEEHAKGLAARLESVIAEPIELAGSTLVVRASIGIVVGRTGATAQQQLRLADSAMYRAKRRGGGISLAERT